jgi:hypothetical protein
MSSPSLPLPTTLPMTEILPEQDHPTNHPNDVWLLWREHDNHLLVSVADEETGDQFTIEVRDGERPLDVFNHPYAYAAWHGIEINAEPQRRLAVRGGVS